MTDDDYPPPPPVFLSPGAPPEAQSLLDRWNEQWPGRHPWRSSARDARPDAVVRFHTLPNGGQELRHNRDARTVSRKFRRIVRATEHVTGLPAAVIIMADERSLGDCRDLIRSTVPGLRPWVTDPYPFPNDDDDVVIDDGPASPLESHSFRSGPVDDDMLTALTRLVHYFDADFMILPEDLSWAASTYDGGVDVVLRTAAEAEALADLFTDWLPPEGWGGFHTWCRDATPRERRLLS
ncbi:DUF3885 domain-containing protein [Frigoribacterium sp. 2-23]|uniref:DUF3885 domain-containing protein n=1 Tax=Frigoribacterium sp. 2-23 TaxID=3415006 RepID=UPI003C7014B2